MGSCRSGEPCFCRPRRESRITAAFAPSRFRGLGHEWKPCVVDIARKLCDVDHPAFWQTIHTLRVTETNGLGSETTTVRVKLHDLCKVTQNAHCFYEAAVVIGWPCLFSVTASSG